MSSVSKISVALTTEMIELVQSAVASGDCATTSEVIREALRDWKMCRAVHEHERAEIVRLWNDGLKGGPARFATMDAIKAEARRRVEAPVPNPADAKMRPDGDGRRRPGRSVALRRCGQP